MPDLLPAAEALAEKRCLVTLRNQPDFVLLQPIDARDTLSQEMPLLAAQTTQSFLHVAFPVEGGMWICPRGTRRLCSAGKPSGMARRIRWTGCGRA